MQKIFFSALLGILLVGLLSPIAVSAQTLQDCCKINRIIPFGGVDYKPGWVGETGGYCPGSTAQNLQGTKSWGLICTLNVINTVIDWVFIFLILAVVVMVIMAAIELLTTQSTENIFSAKGKIVIAALALLIAFGAKAVPSLVQTLLGY
jgi:hypothetical protein